MRIMSSISRWKRSGGGEDGIAYLWRRGSIIRGRWMHGALWKGWLHLQKIALHPALQVVIFRLDLTPRSRRHGLVVAREQHARAFAQHTCPLRLGTGLEPH